MDEESGCVCVSASLSIASLSLSLSLPLPLSVCVSVGSLFGDGWRHSHTRAGERRKKGGKTREGGKNTAD